MCCRRLRSARGGEIFILDMGKPVRIVDVARDMIRLSGLRPDEDIEVHFTGIRPGEKLFEELATTEDRVQKTRHPKIFIGKIPKVDSEDVRRSIESLVRLAHGGNGVEIRAAFRKLIPEATLGLVECGDGGSPGAAKPVVEQEAFPPKEGATVIPLRSGARAKKAGVK